MADYGCDMLNVPFPFFKAVYLCLSVCVYVCISMCVWVCALQFVMAAGGLPGTRATDCVTKVAISISCENLLDMDTFSKSDPLCVLLMNSSGPHWCEVSRFKDCSANVSTCCESKECLTDSMCKKVPDCETSVSVLDWPDRENQELP